MDKSKEKKIIEPTRFKRVCESCAQRDADVSKRFGNKLPTVLIAAARMRFWLKNKFRPTTDDDGMTEDGGGVRDLPVRAINHGVSRVADKV